MRPEYRRRWEQEINRLGGRLKKPRDLLLRGVSADDFMDSAVIGGVSLADVLAGRVAESQIPYDVLDAFHAQYPEHGATFVDAVKHLSSNPEHLEGLINGVKGKLFETDYAAFLNEGHLPAGYTAELAVHANNPGWDIAIRDAHGHIDQVLQLKATESVDYVKQAIAAHPSIDVVVPHELYEKLADHPALLDHVIDSRQHLDQLNDHVTHAVDHADAAGLHFHFPIIAIAFAVGQNFIRWRVSRQITLREALQDTTERGVLALVSTGAGWALAALAHEPTVGLASIPVRLFGGQALHNWHRREELDQRLQAAHESIMALSLRVQRPILGLAE